MSQDRLNPQSRGRGCRLCGRQQQTEENTVLEEETSIHTDSEYSSGVCEVVVTNSLGSDTEETDHSLNHLELPRPIFQIRPRMYVRRTIMYEIAAFCSPEEHA